MAGRHGGVDQLHEIGSVARPKDGISDLVELLRTRLEPLLDLHHVRVPREEFRQRGVDRSLGGWRHSYAVASEQVSQGGRREGGCGSSLVDLRVRG